MKNEMYRVGFGILIVVVLTVAHAGDLFVDAQNTKTEGQAMVLTASSLTGNWAVKNPRNDGTFSKVYFNLKHDGDKIRGTIRSTQFYYTITDSTGDTNGFALTASMKDGKSDRTVKYEGKLVGDELRLSTRRRPEDKPTESVERRVPDGEGVLPGRLPLPANN